MKAYVKIVILLLRIKLHSVVGFENLRMSGTPHGSELSHQNSKQYCVISLNCQV